MKTTAEKPATNKSASFEAPDSIGKSRSSWNCLSITGSSSDVTGFSDTKRLT